MSNYIIKITDSKKLKDYYMEYSTDNYSPVSSGMNISSFKNWYKHTYGNTEYDNLKEKLLLVESNGCSGLYPYDTVESIVLESIETLIYHYCKDRKSVV